MRIRPKTKRRLIILTLATAVLATGATVLYVYHNAALDRTAEEHLARGLEAYENGDWTNALDGIGRYVQRQERRDREIDSETWFKYARARRNVPVPNNRHIADAIHVLANITGERPDFWEAQRELLDLYVIAGYDKEGLAVADRILEAFPNDAKALKARTIVLVRLRRFEEAKLSAFAVNEAAPLDLEGHFLTLSVLQRMEATAEEIIGRAEAVRDAHPDDPRFLLLLGRAHMLFGHTEEAEKLITEAAAHEPPDHDFLRALLADLERLSRFDLAFSVLEKAARGAPDAEVFEMWIRRLFNAGRYEDLLSATDGDLGRLRTVEVALRAKAFIALERPDEAGPSVVELKSREDDRAARAWLLLLEGVALDPDGDPRRQVEVCDEAIQIDPDNPYIETARGAAYSRLGEVEIAVQCWERAAGLSRDWPEPLIRAGQALLAAGRVDHAVSAIQLARRRSPKNMRALLTQLLILNEHLDELRPEQQKDLLSRVGEMREMLPGNPLTISLEVDLLAREGRRDEALAKIRETYTSEPPPAEVLLLRLAAISEHAGLGEEERCYRRSRELHGTTARLAIAMASWHARNGRPEEAKRVFAEGDGQGLEWLLAKARFLESTKDAAALEAWTALGDAHPDDLEVQRAVLRSQVVWSDRDFTKRSWERLRDLTGERSFGWRRAKARWLLMQPEVSPKDAATAASLLGELVRNAPDVVPTRMLLSRALEHLGSTEKAIENLKAIAELGVAAVPVNLELSRLYAKSGQNDNARDALLRVLRTDGVPMEHLRAAAGMLERAGYGAEAAQALERLDVASHPEMRLLLARLEFGAGDPARAEELARTAHETPSEESTTLLAEALAAQGRIEEARQILAELDGLDIPDGRKWFIRARFESRYGLPENAVALYEKAIEADPGQRGAYTDLLCLLAAARKGEDLERMLATARERFPDDEVLAGAVERSDLLLRSLEDTRLVSVVVQLLKTTRDREALLSALELFDRQRAGKIPDEDLYREIKQLALDHPKQPDLTMLTANEAARLGFPADGVDMAGRAMHEFPRLGAPAQTQARLLFGLGRLPEALAAADEWKRRSPGESARADLLAAQILIQQGEPDDAIRRLTPHMENAKDHPVERRDWITVYSRALQEAGRSDAVSALLAPSAKKALGWRRIWIGVVSSSSPAAAAAAHDLTEIAGLTDEDPVVEQLDLAGAWLATGHRFSAAEHLEEARRILSELEARPDLDAATWMTIGFLRDDAGDLKAAAAAYRKALSMKSDLYPVMNNLAMILHRQGENREALELAEKVVRAVPGEPEYQDTLARIYAAQSDHGRAAQCLEIARRLSPSNLKWYVPLAEALVLSEKTEEARAVIQALDLRRGQGLPFPAGHRDRLLHLREKLK